MLFSYVLLPGFLLFNAVLAAPTAHGLRRHHPQKIDIDEDIIARLERLFADPYSFPGAGPRPEVEKRQTGSDTRNQLNDGKCAGVVIIYARGTTSSGNIGTGVGPAFVDALIAKKNGNAIAQGVMPYPATVLEYLQGGSEIGATSMASLVQKAATQCPDARIVLGGYSQGAQVTHKAAAKLSTGLYGRIGAIVLFGDPFNGDPFPGALNDRVKTYCRDDDPICDGIPLPIGGHLKYAEDAGDAASWAAART